MLDSQEFTGAKETWVALSHWPDLSHVRQRISLNVLDSVQQNSLEA